MREIKFRAWDGQAMHYLDLYQTYDDDPRDIVFRDHEYEEQGWIDTRLSSEVKSILMQYTGLKDKGGKEIYEGDILREDWDNIYGEYIGKTYVVHFGEYDDSILEWGSPGIGFYGVAIPEDPEYGIQSIVNMHGPSIIGTVYENPELMEPKP